MIPELRTVTEIIQRVLFSTPLRHSKSNVKQLDEFTVRLIPKTADKLRHALRELDKALSVGKDLSKARLHEHGTCIRVIDPTNKSETRYRVQISQSEYSPDASTYTLTARLQTPGLKSTPLPELIIQSHPNAATGEAFHTLFRSGLLIVAGQTGSGKTTICGHLVKHLFCGLLSIKNAPVFVTVEDPPELLNVLPHDLFAHSKSARKVKVIAREIPFHAALDGALRDALRQTPDLVYVGEIRDIESWRAMIEFAKTGHRVLTTCHAGSIRECFLSLIESIGGPNRSPLSLLAGLQGIIHITPHFDADSAETIRLPTCWWSTPLARSQFDSAGVRSLIPSRASGSADKYFIGRSYFAERIRKPSNMRKRIISAAIHLDLL